eukprot:Colp12_sorted_trinity150504_noHs@4748
MGFCDRCGEPVRNAAACKCGGRSGAPITDMQEGKFNVGDQYSNAYLSQGLSQGVDAGLRRMLDMKPSEQEVDCKGCNKRLQGNGDIYPGRFDGEPYCLPCYTERDSLGNCKACGNAVLGLGKPYVREGADIWHKECYNGVSCFACSKPIFGESVEAISQQYHPDCFACSGCNAKLSDGFYNKDGKPVCKACSTKVTTTVKKTAGAGASDAASTRAAINAAAQKRQNELNQMQKGFEGIQVHDKCAKCGDVMAENGVMTGDKVYHERCFVCSGCGKGFTDGRFVPQDGQFWHKDCIVAATVPKCTLCSQPLSFNTPYYEYNGGKIHTTCLKCGMCSKTLGGNVPFADHLGKPHCGACLQKVARGGMTVVGSKEGGFTVDPMSGQRVGTSYGGFRGGVTINTGPGNQCPRCKKTVYAAEKAVGPNGATWHKTCLTCADCRRPVDQGSLATHGDEAYCKPCHSKKFGPKGVGYGQGAGALSMGQ